MSCITFTTEVAFPFEKFSLMIREHPGNSEYTEFVIIEEEEKDDLLFCIPTSQLGMLISALQCHQRATESDKKSK